jgi:hypothetical protein
VQAVAFGDRYVEADHEGLFGTGGAEVPLEAGGVVMGVHRAGEAEHQAGELLLRGPDGGVDLVPALGLEERVGVAGVGGVELVDLGAAGRRVGLVPDLDVALGSCAAAIRFPPG